MMKKDSSSVGVFLKTSRAANVAPEALASEALETVTPGPRPAPGPAQAPARDPAGEVIALLGAGPLSPAEIARRLDLTATEAIAVLERLEHFGFVEVADEGAQRLVRATGS